MKARYVVLAVLMATAVTSALAVPIIQVTVQQLGAGYSAVLSPAEKAWVNHVFAIKNGRIVLDKVVLAFDKNLSAGTYIRVELRDSNDNVLASGEVTLSTALKAGQRITIDLTPDLGIYDIIKYSKVVLVVAGPQVST